jgi:hypothetical protein
MRYAPERVFLCICFQVTPNLYGTLVANTAAGIAGGTGVMPGGISIHSHFFFFNCYSRRMMKFLFSFFGLSGDFQW